MNKLIGLNAQMPFLNVLTTESNRINSKVSSNLSSNNEMGKSNFYSTLQQIVSMQGNVALQEGELSERNGDEELLQILHEWLENLLPENRHLNRTMLEHEGNNALIDEIPHPYIDELLSLFSEEIQIDELIREDGINNPVHLLALMLVFSHFEENERTLLQGEGRQIFTLLYDKMTKHFPIPIMNKDDGSWSNVVESLTEQVKFLNDENMKQSNHHLRAWLTSINEKYNEQDVVKSLYERYIQQNRGDKATNTPILSLDVSNSHMSRVQQFFLHSGDEVATRQTEQQFLRQIENILARSQFRQLGNGIQQLTVKLHPASLGRLDITLQQVNGVIVAKMMTTTTIAKELIESQIHQLRHAFIQQQLPVDRIEVIQQQETETNSLTEKEHDEEGREHHQKDHEKGDDSFDEESFAAYLEETINMKV